ncbi:MAG: DPP IV N-terminal domain-containing protein [Chloroflexota bacterium]
MKTQLATLLSILALSVMLVACDGNTTTQPVAPTAVSAVQPAAGTLNAQRTRPANGAGSTAVVSTPAANTDASANVVVAPTAIPLPTIVLPTPVPAAPVVNRAPAPTDAPVAAAPSAPKASPATTTTTTSLQDLRGQIVFFSDRGGEYPQLYMMNADGSNQRLCNCSDVLQTLVTNDVSSPDKQQALFVKQVGGRQADYQIWAHNTQTNEDKVVTGGAPGFPTVDYDAVWSPDSKHIAWVTEANGFDEIYVYDRTTNENVRLTESHGEWYKHPSFSPDGARIVFWSNHDDANTKQIWVMNLDGSNQHNLSQNPSNDWDPIWVK